MVALAIAGSLPHGLHIEERRGGWSYSVYTLAELRRSTLMTALSSSAATLS